MDPSDPDNRGERRGFAYRAAFFLPLAFLALWDALLYNPFGTLVARRSIDHAPLLATSLDASIPYVPAFVIPYLLAWLMPPAVVIALWVLRVELDALHRVFFAFLALFAVLHIAWFLWPVRARLDAPDLGPGPLVWLAAWVRSDSSAWNSCPSMHVAGPWLLVRVMQLHTRRGHAARLITFGVVAASTVFLRLHYLADVAAGWLAAEAVHRAVLAPLERIRWRLPVSRVVFNLAMSSAVTGVIAAAVWAGNHMPAPETYPPPGPLPPTGISR